MSFPTSSVFPAAVDPVENRVNHIDIVEDDDFNWQELKIEGLQTWLIGRVTFSIRTGRLTYVQAAVPVESVVGQFQFDTSKLHSGVSVFIRCMINPTFSAVGDARIYIDDLGPVGAPAAPVRIVDDATSGFILGADANGLVSLVTDAFDIGTGAGYPGPGKIAQGNRMYEAVVYQNSAVNDVVDVGFVEMFATS